MAQPTPPQPPTTNASATNIISALGAAFKTQTGDPLSGEKIAQLLLQNMPQLGELCKQGKLNHAQIMQLKEYADRHKASAQQPAASTSTSTATPATPTPSTSTAINAATKTTANPVPFLSEASGAAYPISSTPPAVTNTGPVHWQSAHQGRPTLTGGVPSGRVSGTPAQIARPADDASTLTLDETRTRRKNSPGDQAMRRSIQDLVSSIDPNVRIEPEVEDLLLDIADEFIDSVANFGCRLAKHRGGDTLEVKDLQLHLERNHNIRIPGFASDETRISLSQTSVTPAAPTLAANKKGTTSNQVTLRSHRLAQVAQAKREAKLM